MNNSKRLNLNLASNPLRNKKYFYLIFSFICIAFLFVSIPAGRVYIKHLNKVRDLKVSILRLDKDIKSYQTEEKRYFSQIEEAKRRDKDEVELINTLIFKKSFSWIDFFSTLEKALPDSCFIVTLVPFQKGESKMQIRLKVASLSLNELLKFVTNLYSLKFSQIKLLNETKNNEGFLIWEISLVYERNI